MRVVLWYKCWLETRWRFLIGLALLTCSAAGLVFEWPRASALLRTLPALNLRGEIGRRVNEAFQVQREYPGYIWSQWFHQNLAQMWTFFAVLLGTGGLLSRNSGDGALFTLSLPVSRTGLVAIRAAAALAELLVLAFIPSLLIPLLSPVVGESYSVGAVLIHGACLSIGGAAFFSLAFLLSTVFSDIWRPPLIALIAATAIAVCEQAIPGLSNYGPFHVMSAETWFRSRTLPWEGLLASGMASALMLFGAAVNIARRDF